MPPPASLARPSIRIPATPRLGPTAARDAGTDPSAPCARSSFDSARSNYELPATTPCGQSSGISSLRNRSRDNMMARLSGAVTARLSYTRRTFTRSRSMCSPTPEVRASGMRAPASCVVSPSQAPPACVDIRLPSASLRSLRADAAVRGVQVGGRAALGPLPRDVPRGRRRVPPRTSRDASRA